MKRAVFLDRDGVLNALVHYSDFGEYESPRVPKDLDLLPGVVAALQRLQAAGWLLVLVSNQPSYAKGKISLADLQAVSAALEAALAVAGVELTRACYSYTHPAGVVEEYTTESVYRKPNPGFLLDAARDFAVDLGASWMIGDRDSDVVCGQWAGCHTALVRYSLSADRQGSSQPDWVVDDLSDFVHRLCA